MLDLNDKSATILCVSTNNFITDNYDRQRLLTFKEARMAFT
jgi:hypothetical protein